MTRLLLPAVIVALCVGCDSGPAEVEAGDLVVTPVADGVLLETEAEYPCSNYQIVVRSEADRNVLSVEVEGVEEPEGCLTALGPARALVPYPEIYSSGFEIVLEKDGVVDRYVDACGVGGCSFGPIGTPSFSRPGPR